MNEEKIEECLEILRGFPIEGVEDYAFAICADHPHLDTAQELRNMRAWLRDNPKRRPKSGSRGYKAFITRWLNRVEQKDCFTQSRGGRREKTNAKPLRKKRDNY